jgi:hypothetical protein
MSPPRADRRVPRCKGNDSRNDLRMAVPDDGGDLDPEAVAELRRLARSRPRSGREAVAKASALRTLERLRRGKRRVPPMPDGWYPQEPGDPFYELDWVFLHEHPELLRRHGSWRGARGGCEVPRLLPPQTVPSGPASRMSCGRVVQPDSVRFPGIRAEIEAVWPITARLRLASALVSV